MRASSYIMVSLVLSAFGTLGYHAMMPDPKDSPGLAGSGADKEMKEITDFMDEQFGGFGTDAYEKFDHIQNEQDELNEILAEESPKPPKAKPKEKLAPDAQSAPQPAQDIAATPTKEKPASTPAPNTSGKTELEEERDAGKPVPQRTVMRGADYPYKIIVPAGWKIVKQDEERIILSWNDDVFVFFETGPWRTTQDEWAEKSLEDIQLSYPFFEAVAGNTMEIDGRTWGKLYLQETGTPLANPREMLLLTYGDRRRGSYRIIITGTTTALDSSVDEVNLLLSTYRFPPDNFKPEDISTVRVYIDGKRQYY